MNKSTQKLTLFTTLAVVVVLVALFAFSQRGPEPQAAVVEGDFELARQPSLGSAEAPVELIVFEDFQCPHCRVFEEEVMPLIIRDYVNPGLARLYFIGFQFLGPDSVTAGIAVECAYRQDEAAFWDYKTYIYRSQAAGNQDWATPRGLVATAREYVPELDGDELHACLLERRYEDVVLRDRNIAQAAGIAGTPAVLVDRVPVASPSYEAVSQAVETQLAQAPAER